MSLAAVAIVVASISALFTGANMAVSYATYRRGRPRVELRTDWLINRFQSPEHPFEEGVYLLNLYNKSQAAVKVANVYTDIRTVSPKRGWTGQALKILRFERDGEIPPFGGIELLAQILFWVPYSKA
ncbi:hypothetical protein [Streptomyces sp. NBC_00299]|uniref:hypothetical protein n=1 Tax=Streptomyces sp. NBC_00299 TaxID=2975705 RepID=UPI002E2E4385|nr:hypothetical protein [Streptomyces sp. NBC_00299]